MDDHGKFETPIQRMDRLKRVCTCPDCGVEHIRYDGQTQTKIKCDDCRELVNKKAALKGNRKKAEERKSNGQGKVSSWHKFKFGGF